MTATKGLTLSVYSHPRYRGCTNGPTKVVDEITVVGTIDRTKDHLRSDRRMTREVEPLDRYSQVFDANDERPAFALVLRAPTGTPILSLEPVEWRDDEGRWTQPSSWYCAGGSFAGTTDSRFSELCRTLLDGSFYGAVTVHDRREW